MSTPNRLSRFINIFEERIAPRQLAEAWDNTGLLLEGPMMEPSTECNRAAFRVMLCNDLTQRVAKEAIDKEVDLVLSYHPSIFRPLKSITNSVPMQSALLILARGGKSLYCPHTQLDTTSGGINDYLCDAFKDITSHKDGIQKHDKVEGAEVGRLVTLRDPQSVEEIIKRIKKHLGIDIVRVAGRNINNKQCKTIAVCCGSGGSLICPTNADVLWTGEMSHHEVLASAEDGKVVVLCEHATTERPYLEKRLKPWIEREMTDDVDVIVSKEDTTLLRYC
ncbi:Protein anon-35F/36A, putative [Perkinsus marinus ATCC 50983]|uniref:Protein anon-35F/36A, putative n=1 Tax=Perkinsus marinus (strain ATCC 50983 / TXsc) TaxID=423536 RepID=C5L0P9_PERM5|nr:Protein anon-35F/36A, putative [Perkinsus marinus ATCC 50983]EER09701.1 Protein anon-35F/36A, putative [Perkinsus marinus ATCC 50983]|eukprot:XP_002777906.1 Protein anon-35F/36A, putative [Perkinsus marinus ATCC 50983]